ncbi:hypothetical protein A2U01_0055364, partial [Trifolium medium]|nr:hypothetical protein [Trifolium medium]
MEQSGPRRVSGKGATTSIRWQRQQELEEAGGRKCHRRGARQQPEAESQPNPEAQPQHEPEAQPHPHGEPE